MGACLTSPPQEPVIWDDYQSKLTCQCSFPVYTPMVLRVQFRLVAEPGPGRVWKVFYVCPKCGNVIPVVDETK